MGKGCGRVHKYGQCPAFSQMCRKCGAMNHFAKRCTLVQRLTQMVESGECAEECLVLFIKLEKIGRKLLVVLSVSVNKLPIVKLICQLDSAAT